MTKRPLLRVAQVALILLGAICWWLWSTVTSEQFVDLAVAYSRSKALPPSTITAVAQLPGLLLVAGGLCVGLGATFRYVLAALRATVIFADTTSRTRFLTVGLLAGGLIRAVYALSIDNPPVADWLAYDQAAAGLLRGEGYTEEGRISALRPPAYPFVLAALYLIAGPGYVWPKLLNVALGLGTCLLVYLIGSRVSERVGRVAMVMALLFPTQVYFAALLATEPLFTFLFLLSIWLLMDALAKGARLRRVFASGLTLGLSVLVRPVPILLPLWLAAHASTGNLPARNRLTRAVGVVTLVTAGMLLVVMPWTVRNWLVFHQVIPVSSSGAMNFWHGEHAQAAGGPQTPADYSEVETRYGGNMNAGYFDGLRFMLEHPDRFARLVLPKLDRLLGSGNYGVNWELGEGHQSPMPDLIKIILGRAAHWYWVGIGLLASMTLGLPRHQTAAVRMLWWVVGYWIVFHIVFFGQPRFHFPLEPILSVLAACTICQLLGSWSRRATG